MAENQGDQGRQRHTGQHPAVDRGGSPFAAQRLSGDLVTGEKDEESHANGHNILYLVETIGKGAALPFRDLDPGQNAHRRHQVYQVVDHLGCHSQAAGSGGDGQVEQAKDNVDADGRPRYA